MSDFYSSIKPKNYILTGRPDKFMKSRALEYRLKNILKNENFHILWHSFAKDVWKSGIDKKVLCTMLEHVSVNITLNRDVHSSIEPTRKSMEKLSVFSSRQQYIQNA